MIGPDELTRDERDALRRALGLPIERLICLSRIPDEALRTLEELVEGEIVRRQLLAYHGDGTVTVELVVTPAAIRRIEGVGAVLTWPPIAA